MRQQLTRTQALAAINEELFDAVIIGGGINGAAVARDAALRGLKVCLFEQGDFASGTSSKSTKIAHGGLRYLRNFEFGLVRESQRERLLLRKLLPHLVSPQSFCYPVYDDGPDPMWKVRLGLTVYDNLGGPGNKEKHTVLTAREALNANPRLRARSLSGAIRYWDDRMDDSRICVENILSAEDAGARCFNYTRVTAARRRPSALFEIEYEDTVAGTAGVVRSRAIVNCAGPWTDRVMTDVLKAPSRQLAPTKGVHIVVPRFEGQDALILENPRDRRVFFAIPWEDTTLIGTTDTRYDGDPAAVQVEDADIDYLLDAANYFLPASSLSREDVITSFAGLRPLIAPAGSDVPEGKISRRHRVAIEPEGVITLVGGKYTTFRKMAEDAVDALAKTLGDRLKPCETTSRPYFPTIDPRADRRADLGLWAALVSRYGARAGSVFDFCLSHPELAQPLFPGHGMRLGEVIYAMRFEKAMTLDDVIYRRTRLSWNRDLTETVRGRLAAAVDRFAPPTA